MHHAPSATGDVASPHPPLVILGVPFDAVTTEETVSLIAAMVASRRPHYIATANVDFVVQALEDVELRRILFDAHLVLADGMPLVWASRQLGQRLPERVAGSNLVPRLLRESEQRGWRVFFLGGTADSVAQAAANSRAKHPALQLVGAYSPPFKPLLEMDHADTTRRIQDARPDLLLVAFGCPKQEKWINMHYRTLGVPVSIGVGATIDFLAGTVRRAPVWMQQTGTEWVFRLAQEPKRLASRYSKGFRVFARAIVQQVREFRSRPPRQTLSPPPPDPAAPARAPGPAVPQVIETPPHLDAAAAATLSGSWLEAAARGPVILDLAATSFIDSTGVGLLIRLQRRAREAGHKLVLSSPTAPVDRALALMRLESFFERAPDRAAARDACVSARPPGPTLALEAGILRWEGEVTAATLPHRVEPAVTELAAVPEGSRITVDLAGVPFADSSGIGLMVRLKRDCWRRGVRLVFANPSPALQDVLRLTRLTEYLTGDPA